MRTASFLLVPMPSSVPAPRSLSIAEPPQVRTAADGRSASVLLANDLLALEGGRVVVAGQRGKHGRCRWERPRAHSGSIRPRPSTTVHGTGLDIPERHCTSLHLHLCLEIRGSGHGSRPPVYSSQCPRRDGQQRLHVGALAEENMNRLIYNNTGSEKTPNDGQWNRGPLWTKRNRLRPVPQSRKMAGARRQHPWFLRQYR